MKINLKKIVINENIGQFGILRKKMAFLYQKLFQESQSSQKQYRWVDIYEKKVGKLPKFIRKIE